MSKIVVVDGNSIMFRAYYATAYTGNLMKTSSGIYTNAIYTFIIMMNKIMSIDGLTNIFIAFDKGKKTKRHQEYGDYKGTRTKMPEELAMQIPYIKEYLDVVGINRLELDDYEADDIVGTVAFRSKNVFDEVEIISGDRDLLQLVQDNIKVFLTKKGLTDLDEYNKDNFFEKLDFYPNQLIDYKGLIGDSSDNLPGIPGVGPKTATKLLKEYQTLDNLIENVDSLKGKVKEQIVEFKEQALKTKHLATIYTDADFELDLESTKVVEPNKKILKQYFERFEFNSFIKRLGEITEKDEVVSDEQKVELNYQVVVNPDNINLSKVENISVEVEISEDNYHHASLLGVTLFVNNTGYYFDKEHINEEVVNILKDVNIKKYLLDSKKTITVLSKNNMEINNVVFDLTLGAYLVDPVLGPKDYNDICERFSCLGLGYAESVYGKKNPYVIDNIEEVIEYSVKKCLYLTLVMPKILKKLAETKALDLLYKMELPLARVLAEVELNGFKVDKNRLDELGNIFNQKLKVLEENIYLMAGHEFNISSPKQLGVIIFEEMQLAKGKKNKTGYSTAADVLEKLAKKHPFPKMILEYRKYAKLVSTYINGLEEQIHHDGLVHTIFKQALTLTGRLSSTEPNIQNIPIRTEEGRLIRSAFVPRTGDGVLVSADYSQIELRVLASISNCQAMIEEINNGVDFHSSTAAKIFNIELNEVTKEMRRIAKAVNFGIVYGMSAYGLSEDLSISVADATNFINRYFEIYPEIKKYLNDVVNNTLETGYTETLFNRRRYIPEIQNSNYNIQEFGKRTAMNAPIQGTAADIMKYAMISVQNKLKELNLKSKMVAQVHDELIIDCVKEEVEIVSTILKETMQSVVDINVLLDVDVETGSNWNLK